MRRGLRVVLCIAMIFGVAAGVYIFNAEEKPGCSTSFGLVGEVSAGGCQDEGTYKWCVECCVEYSDTSAQLRACNRACDKRYPPI